MSKPTTPAFSRPLATTRLYFEVKMVEPELPSSFGSVRLSKSEKTAPFAGEASSPHKKWPYFFEAEGSSFDEAHKLLRAYVTSVRVRSDVHVNVGPYAVNEAGWSHTIEPVPKIKAASWGHYGDVLSVEALQFAQRFAPRLAHFSMRQSFNRVSNALRLYESALDLIPSDIALVVFVAVLEGLFSTATQELSYRLALAVSWFLAAEADERLLLFKDVKDLYTIRSKVVHGDRVTGDEEHAAILLAENYVPRVEEIVRCAIRKILEEGLEGFVETTKHLDEFYQLLALGCSVGDALARVGASGATPKP